MVNIGDNYLLCTQLSDGTATAYPRCRIYYSGSKELNQSPKDLTHISGGLYTSCDFIPSSSGYYAIVCTIFSGSNYDAIQTGYGRTSDTIYVDNIEDDINYISSQLFPSSNIITHGDSHWMSSNISTIWDEPMVNHKTFGTYGSGLRFVHQIESGRWLRSGNQMTFYNSSNNTLATFNLYTSGGTLAGVDENAFERQRV